MKRWLLSAGDVFTYVVARAYGYSENFDLAGAVDSFGVLPWERAEGSDERAEIVLQYLALNKERRLHVGREVTNPH